MAFGADALIADATGHVVIKQAVRHLPGRVLQVSEGVQIDDRGAEGRRDMDRSSVVGEQQRGGGKQRRKFGKVELTDQRGRGEVHLLANEVYQVALGFGAGENGGDAPSDQRSRDLSKQLWRIAARGSRGSGMDHDPGLGRQEANFFPASWSRDDGRSRGR